MILYCIKQIKKNVLVNTLSHIYTKGGFVTHLEEDR